ncbi:MAG: VWA domain-containing protein [Candidatus Poribacteria bacterium]|nr:VWA domain-containing protein [Candidatus Poribacteria bacterium]
MKYPRPTRLYALPPRPIYRSRAKEAWHQSRTLHTSLVSITIHVFIYLLLALQWVKRPVPVEKKPLMDEASLEVVFISEKLLPSPIAPATTTESAESSSSAPTTTPTPPKRSTPPPKPKSNPPPKRVIPVKTPTTQPQPESKPVEVPQPTLVATTVRQLQPDPNPVVTEPSALPETAHESDSTTNERERVENPSKTDAIVKTDVAGQGASQSTEASSQATPDYASMKPSERRRARIGQALTRISDAATSGDGPRSVDIVFLLDISGSMENNIMAISENLVQMMNQLNAKGYDATFGVVKFAVVTIKVFPQSRDATRFVRLLENMQVGGDERALDALVKAADKVQFRGGDVSRRFVLVTDEPLKGSSGSLTSVIPLLQRSGIVVDVIGLDIPEHRLLARATGGTWFLIPGNESGS